MLTSIIISGLIFPVIQSWTKGDGFLFQNGYIDNTNASGTFLIGSIVGFVGNCILGPRYSFYKHNLSKMAAHSKKMRKFKVAKKTSTNEKPKYKDNTDSDQSDKE